MPGLSLRAGLGASAGGPIAGYATQENLHPMPAQSPTGPRRSTARAFGYTAGGGRPGGAALYGGVFGGTIAAILLVALWWALPR